MKITVSGKLPATTLHIIPLIALKKGVKRRDDSTLFSTEIKQVSDSISSVAKKGRMTIWPAKGHTLLFIGLGEEKKASGAILEAYSKAVVTAQQAGKDALSCAALKSEKEQREMLTGLAVGGYQFDQYQSKSKKRVKSTVVVTASKKSSPVVKEISSVMEGVNLAKDLVMMNADDADALYLEKCARDLKKHHPKIGVKILKKDQIKKLKMDLFLAVNLGSHKDPRFIEMTYHQAPKAKSHLVVIGKGVTFDTGGLNLKPTGHIETMKQDMAGSASAFGLMKAVASLGLKVNLTVLVAATENPIDSASYKPGDVFSSMKGTTVEIGNTDAEGRLTLADAITYAQKKLTKKPTAIIDMATLTGAIVVGLGQERVGLFSNSNQLTKSIQSAADEVNEKVWPMPMDEEYRELLDSSIADISSTGTRREAGSITAAKFLEEFVEGDLPWAHLDIAGTAYLEPKGKGHTVPATGTMVRTLVELLKNMK